jgi:hypothetical protein
VNSVKVKPAKQTIALKLPSRLQILHVPSYWVLDQWNAEAFAVVDAESKAIGDSELCNRETWEANDRPKYEIFDPPTIYCRIPSIQRNPSNKVLDQWNAEAAVVVDDLLLDKIERDVEALLVVESVLPYIRDVRPSAGEALEATIALNKKFSIRPCRKVVDQWNAEAVVVVDELVIAPHRPRLLRTMTDFSLVFRRAAIVR